MAHHLYSRLAAAESDKWVPVKEPGKADLWEHAEWIDGGRLRKDLCEVLFDCHVEDSLFTPPERVEAILSCEAPFVALVKKGNRFSNVVDRGALLEAVAVKAVASSRERAR